MYINLIILSVLYGVVKCANYQRYGDDGRYSFSSTIANLYNQYPQGSQYKTGSYASDIASFPEATRYPNHNPTYTTNKYNAYTTQRSNIFVPDYSTQRYGQGYGQEYNQGYGQGYGQEYNQGYGQGYGQGYNSYERPFMGGIGDYCVNRSPQNGIWVDSLMGMWFGVEVIQHLAGDSRLYYGSTCIVIHISEPKDKPSTGHQAFHVQQINAKFHRETRQLRLLWDEGGNTIEYSLYFKNSSVGYWHVFDGQNGTLPALPRYQQFAGTIQVLKAVHNHLVLNFCQEAKNDQPAQLYSALFSRDPGQMSQWEINSIHSLLQTKKLSVASRRMVCGSNAHKPFYSIVVTISLYILTVVSS